MSSSTSGAVLLKLLLVAAALVLGVICYMFFMQSRSVLYRYFEGGSPTKEPAFAIFNPFRNRQPERIADEFLQRLKSGECEVVMSGLIHEVQYQQNTCEQERTNGLISWRLRNRTDEPQSVRMYFQVARQKYPDLMGQAWITVEKRGDTWQVSRYDRSY